VDEAEFKARTKRLALEVLGLVGELPRTAAGQVIARQLAKSGTSVAANYRAACRARSLVDMVSKLGIVEEEADESMFWLELIVESGMLPSSRVTAVSR
jgi:four helix bundle protein